MKVVKLNSKKGLLKGIIKANDDLIVLSYVIEEGDRLVAFSRRKITVGKSIKIKTVKIGIEVESMKLSETSLELGGKIFYSSEESIPLHKYHTLDLVVKKGFVLYKDRFLNFQMRMLEKSVQKSPKIFICVYEEGYAIFYTITNYSLKKTYEFKFSVPGKRFENKRREVFFEKLSRLLLEQHEKAKWTAFIIGGKGLDNEDLKEKLKNLDATYDTVSYADTGLKELIAKNVINKVVSSTKIAMQRNMISEYLGWISNGEKTCVYGERNIEDAMMKNEVASAITTREFAVTHKSLIERLDRGGTELYFFDERDDSLDTLDGFGGIIIKTK